MINEKRDKCSSALRTQHHDKHFDLKSCSFLILNYFWSCATISQKTNYPKGLTYINLNVILPCYLQFRPTVSLSVLQPYEPSTEVICSLQKNLATLYCTWNHETDGWHKCRLCKVSRERSYLKIYSKPPQPLSTSTNLLWYEVPCQIYVTNWYNSCLTLHVIPERASGWVFCFSSKS